MLHYSEPRSSRRTQDRAWNPHQPEIRAVQPQYQRHWAAGRVLPNPNPSRGGLSLQQQQSPALCLPLPPYRSQPSQLTPITRRNWHATERARYLQVLGVTIAYKSSDGSDVGMVNLSVLERQAEQVDARPPKRRRKSPKEPQDLTQDVEDTTRTFETQ